MQPSAEFFILLAAMAGMWLSLRSDIRALTTELRQINGDPAVRDRDIIFEDALARVGRIMDDPVQRARESLEQRA